MALARLQDPEQILYMQRNYTRLEQKNFEQENQIRNLQRELKSNNFIRAVGEVGDKGAGQ